MTDFNDDDFWVFGYGSLMWKPGFTALHWEPAVLEGYQRRFCIYSTHYRGTPDHPGLVLGLAPGGACPGVAFQVARDNAPAVRDYLRERELIGYAYTEAMLPVALRDSGRPVTCYTFVADPSHRQYAGDLGVGPSAEIIMEAMGKGGLNRDYLINTVRELEDHGVFEAPLHDLLEEVERRTGTVMAGDGI
ncbi:gamma-glutamylcyclotransferase [Caenispirillum salinarum]|uniref:gamma-glutamylcyclotransferase n=1 Tax=Caenispirillum salinarum TaxID=859058 RepID=UPI00384DF89D